MWQWVHQAPTTKSDKSFKQIRQRVEWLAGRAALPPIGGWGEGIQALWGTGILSNELMQEQRLGRSNDGCGCRDWMADFIQILLDGLCKISEAQWRKILVPALLGWTLIVLANQNLQTTSTYSKILDQFLFVVRLHLFELQFLHGFDKGLGLMPHWSASGQSRKQRQGLKEPFKHTWQSSPSSIAVANEVL